MKEYITWSDEMNLGIQELDEQHKQILLIMNKLYEAIMHPKVKKDLVKEIMDDLIQYTLIHFAVEESLFRILRYPAYDEHLRLHADLRKQVVEINNRVQQGHEEDILELMPLLKKWLHNHIMEEDKKYTAFFIERGVEEKRAKKSWFSKILDLIS